MKRTAFLKYLRSQGCELLREGWETFVVAQPCVQQTLGGAASF